MNNGPWQKSELVTRLNYDSFRQDFPPRLFHLHHLHYGTVAQELFRTGRKVRHRLTPITFWSPIHPKFSWLQGLLWVVLPHPVFSSVRRLRRPHPWQVRLRSGPDLAPPMLRLWRMRQAIRRRWLPRKGKMTLERYPLEGWQFEGLPANLGLHITSESGYFNKSLRVPYSNLDSSGLN